MTLRVLHLPQVSNPYLGLLCQALQAEGISAQAQRELPDPATLAPGTILHLHWLHILYGEGSVRVRQRVRDFKGWVGAVRDRGHGLVWTMHNVMPHRHPRSAIAREVRAWLLGQVDAVIVHCEAGKEALVREFGGHPTIRIIPDGNFRAVAPPFDGSQADARTRLRLPVDGFQFLYLGDMRSSKGVTNLVEAFRPIPGGDIRLVLAGKPDGRLQEAALRLASWRDRRIVLRLAFVPDGQIPIYQRAADVVVCPFRSILNSGSFLMALSLGSAVVAPAMGCLPEMAGEDGAIFYGPGRRPATLAEALTAAPSCDLAACRERARQAASVLTWERTAKALREVYEGLLGE